MTPSSTLRSPNVPSTARLTHLRLATEGIARTLENAHPFVTDRFALAHNGSIKPVAEFKKLVSTDELEPHGGDSDTSVLVALITRALNAGLTLSDAVITTVESVSEKLSWRVDQPARSQRERAHRGARE